MIKTGRINMFVGTPPNLDVNSFLDLYLLITVAVKAWIAS